MYKLDKLISENEEVIEYTLDVLGCEYNKGCRYFYRESTYGGEEDVSDESILFVLVEYFDSIEKHISIQPTYVCEEFKYKAIMYDKSAKFKEMPLTAAKDRRTTLTQALIIAMREETNEEKL